MRQPLHLNRLKSLLFAFAPTVALLGGLELVLRVASPVWMFCLRTQACPELGPRRFITQQGKNFSLETGEPLLVYHPTLFWRQRPNVTGSFWRTSRVRTNRLGLRQGPVSMPGRRNVLIVGDSVVWGSTVFEAERFSDRAAAVLAGIEGCEDVQVINAGVVGYSSFQVLQYLRDPGLQLFNPVVTVVCAGVNDSWRATMSDRQRLEFNMRPTSRLWRLLSRSNAFLFFYRYTREFAAWWKTGANPSGLSFLLADNEGPHPSVRCSPSESADNLRRVGNLVAASGGELLVVLEDTRPKYPWFWDPQSFRRGRVLVAELAREQGWRAIDMRRLWLPPLELDVREDLVDFCHPSPRAHAVLGQWVAEAVSDVLGGG